MGSSLPIEFSPYPMIFFSLLWGGSPNTPSVCSCSGPSVKIYNPLYPASQTACLLEIEKGIVYTVPSLADTCYTIHLSGDTKFLFCQSGGIGLEHFLVLVIQWRIQFSSPVLFLGGPGMLSSTSLASEDFFRMTSLSLSAVCMRRTLNWFLGRRQSRRGGGVQMATRANSPQMQSKKYQT